MKADGWCCTICGRFDLREHPEQLAKPYHVSHRGVDIGECPGTFMPFVWLSRMTDGEGGEQAADRDDDLTAKGNQSLPQPAAPGAHGNASRNDVTKPQQSPASDGGLDEIVEDAGQRLRSISTSWEPFEIVKAACIRARETDPRFNLGGRMNAIETGNLYTRMIDAERKLAAVRAWRDEFIEWGPGVSRGWLTKMERKLDAILDGKEAE